MICRKLWLGALAVLALCEAARAAAPTPEQLLPATTTEFVVLSDLRRLEQTWGQSQFGRLLADPVLKPFLDEVYPTTKGANYLFDTIGVSWDTVRNAAGGDLGWGLVLVDGKEVAHVLTLDMAGRREGGNAYFNEIGKCLQKQGARFGQRTYEGMSLVVAELPNGKYILYGHKDDVIVTTDHFGVLGGILARWNNTANDSLANQQAYQKVRARCQTLPGESALIRWYYEPVARVEAQMLFSPELKKVKGDNVAQVLRKEGVDGIKGVGGTLAFVSNGTDILARAAAFAPPPFRGAMRMAKLSNETLASPEAWVPPDVSAWATASIDLPNALDSFETLFERLADEGPGTFQEILKSLKEDKDGPQVDLRHDIFEQMINRVTLINDATLPAQEKSERFLVGLTIKDGRAEKTVADALRKCVESDKRIRARDFEGVRIWEYRPRPSTGKASRTTQPPVVMPSLALAVARGHLFVSTHIELLEKVLTQPADGTLAASPDFQASTAELVRLGMGPSSTRVFCRVQLGARTTYEMMRQNHLVGVESVYAQILLQLVKRDEDGKRLKVDGSKLPPYSQVAPYLSNIGSFMTTHDDGWSITAVSFKK